jgi:uncharacterized protein (TIGR03437 family)
MAVAPSGDVYLAGMAGAGFPVTATAPQPCFSGYLASSAGFVAHLNPQGSLADATYLSIAQQQINSVYGLAPEANGAVEVIWHYAANNVASLIQFGSNGWSAPACLSTTLLNAATMDPGMGVAAGELVTLSGFGIGPETGVGYQPGASGSVPDTLGGVQVLFDMTPAPVLYAQSGQINAIATSVFKDQTATFITVTWNGQQFGGLEVPVVPANPGVFRLSAASSQAAAINQDSTLNGASNPAPPGSIVEIWTTGLGLTAPPCTVGGLNLAQAIGLDPGIVVDVRGLVYAGSAPGLVCGVVQMNVQIPNVPSGNSNIQPGVNAGTAYYVAPVSATLAVK